MKTQKMLLVVTLVTVWVAGGCLFAQEATNSTAPATMEAPAPVVATPQVTAPEPVVAPATTNQSAAAIAAVPLGDGEVEISYNSAELPVVVRTLAGKAGLNLLIGEEVTGKVTVSLKGVSYEDAIRLIVESKGYAFIKDKTVIKVKSRDSLEAEPVQVQVFTLNYAKAEDVHKSLESTLTKQGKMQVDLRSNMLIVTDTPSNLSKIGSIIQTLDAQTPQVMIEAKFVETTKNPRKDLGLNWGQTLLKHELTAGSSKITSADKGQPVSGFQWAQSAPYGVLSPTLALLDAGTFKVLVSYLSQDTDTELLASPRVVTTDNGKAKIAISTQVPIPNFAYSEAKAAFIVQGFSYKDIGIILNVVPHINKNEFITLEVAPETSDFNPKKDANFQGISIPAVDTRSAQTTVLIKSGNTLAIGGLTRTATADEYTKVPLLGDIPGVGALFRSKSLSKERRDLLIFVTPTIIGPDGQTGYESFVDGFPKEELYTNDKWLPKDNAKQRGLFQKDKNARQPAQNFQSR
jgi:type IV pilus assembly protein PilQ